MAEPDKCWVGGCNRWAAASVTRKDLPGQLRLCATHTEQFRQSSDGWGIAWPAGAPVPTSVAAPSSDQLWAYKPGGGEPVETSSPEPGGVSQPLRERMKRTAARFSSRRQTPR
ncbi:MAG: hypothetical protein M3N98_07555 [Actinomycetota bacterium]|nr:hypothetical protein [Actinomycetota bacterium]